MNIAIVGGGVAGASVAIYLRSLGLNPTLFEKRDLLISGPPACHLHAGGNLYPDIDDGQRLQLLKESIEFARFYPQAIEKRPTTLAVPKDLPLDASVLAKRAERLADAYEELVRQNSQKAVLGDPKRYCQTFSHNELQLLAKQPPVKIPRCDPEWMIPFAKMADLQKLQEPILLVREYGINIFRLCAIGQLLLQDADVRFGTKIVDAKMEKEAFWLISQGPEGMKKERFDFLINAAGFESGEIDDMLGLYRERLVEFKAAYIAYKPSDHLQPEIIFHGIRGTQKGMAQYTPYPGGYVQLHGMRKDITLFEDGVAKSEPPSAQPRLSKKYIDMIEHGWPKDFALKRTKKAIEYVSRFVPSFKDAKATPTPLYGAQQIPGRDLSLRAAEISFGSERYARCEIVKVSSILTMADAIVQRLIELGALEPSALGRRIYPEPLPEGKINVLAKTIAQKRGYPTEMATLSQPLLDRSPQIANIV